LTIYLGDRKGGKNMANPILVTGAAGIHQLIVIGLIAHTCVEATVRYGVELGYDVTVVKDAIADYSDVEMRAALEVNMPNYASAIVTTDEIVEAISSL
jgi:ureidoacrylate peracid hydrolase